jgi:hypothetical protein
LFQLHDLLAVLATAALVHSIDPAIAPAGPGSHGSAASVAVGSIQLDERVWGRGGVPTLTFSTSAGRGQPEKVAAFLYVSELPNAFATSPFPPQFIGVLNVPESVQVVVDRTPERGPVNEFSREKFVQGALFDAQTGALVDVTNEDYIDITYEAPAVTYTLDFETDDDFTTPFVNGQGLTTPPEFGRLVSIGTVQPTGGPLHHGAAIFDTDPNGPNAVTSDPDLLVGLGNAVYLQENPGQSPPGIFHTPDDAANGGTIVFDFTGFDFIEKVEPLSIDLIDVDSAGAGMQVRMTDVLGQERIFTAPTGWTEDIAADGPPGYRTLDLTTLGSQPGFASSATATGDAFFVPGEVVRLEIVLLGSGAIDNLVFRKEADPGLRAGPAKVPAPSSGPSGPVRIR